MVSLQAINEKLTYTVSKLEKSAEHCHPSPASSPNSASFPPSLYPPLSQTPFFCPNDSFPTPPPPIDIPEPEVPLDHPVLAAPLKTKPT